VPAPRTAPPPPPPPDYRRSPPPDDYESDEREPPREPYRGRRPPAPRRESGGGNVALAIGLGCGGLFLLALIVSVIFIIYSIKEAASSTVAASSSTSNRSAAWKPTNWTDADCRFTMPGEPDETENFNDGNVTWTTREYNRGTMSYQVTYGEPLRGQGKLTIDEILDGDVQNVLTSHPGSRRTSSTRISLGAYSGRELIASVILDDGATGKLKVRIYYVRGRIYRVGVIGPTDSVDGSDARRFFDSFEFTGSLSSGKGSSKDKGGGAKDGKEKYDNKDN
jgi:hypothetical protein